MTALEPLRILQAFAPASYGGLESVVSQLATGLVARGHHVALAATLTPDRPAPGLLADLADRGVVIETLRLGARAYRAEARALADLAVRHDVGLLHSHGQRSDWVMSRVAAGASRARVATVHGFIPGGLKSRLFEHLQVRALRRFQGVIAVSTPIEARLRRGGVGAGLTRLPNAFDPSDEGLTREVARRELGLPGEATVVGYVGRLGREKGPDVLLEAFGLLERLGAGTPHLCFLGDGPESTALKQRGAALGLGSRLHWPGAVAEAGRLMRAFDAFVLPSRTEGTPMALFEAIAAEVPAVVTLVGGVPDVVGEAEAWRVASEDPAGLAAALAACLGDSAAARQRAARARTRLAEEFAIDPWLAAHESIYRAALAGAGSNASPASLSVAGSQE